jgi:hypothetical protein
MRRTSLAWGWILLPLLILLLPGPARALLIDILGGITLTLLLLPLLAGGAAFLGWQLLRRRLRTCAVCGFSSLGSSVCPACGAPFEEGAAHGMDGLAAADPRDVTINVEAVDVGAEEGDNPGPP